MDVFEAFLLSTQNPTLWEAIAQALFPFGTFANRPTAANIPVNSFYFATDTSVLYQNQAGTWVAVSGSAGSGDVVGPGSATNNAPVVFDGTTGKLIKAGGPFGDVVGPGSATDEAPVVFDGTTGKLVKAGGPFGDVVGPGSAVDEAYVVFDGTTGKLVKQGSAPSGGGAMTLIETKTVTGSAVSTLTFSGLDGNADGYYQLMGKVISGDNSVGIYAGVRFNGDTTTNEHKYYEQWTNAAADGDNCRLAYISQSNTTKYGTFTAVIYPKTGLQRSLVSQASGFGVTQYAFSRIGYEGIYKNTATNITSLELMGSSANLYGVGTIVSLYKIADT